jgi:hypothetical protein
MPSCQPVLITNLCLDGRTGTETSVRDLAAGLQEADCRPMVYSPRIGEMGREIAAAGIPVVDDLDSLPRAPVIVHGHHHVETVRALLRFPDAVGLFVCHDRLAWHDHPPVFPRLLRYVAVDRNCRERLAAVPLLPPDRIRVIYNWVDTKRFLRRPPLPARPRRALVFSNYATPGTHLDALREACGMAGIPLDVAGAGVGALAGRPEELLPHYDLVFAKGKCALEAMACGAAVVLCDTRGLGPMVRAETAESLREWNFGMRCLQMPLEAGEILKQIRRYDAADAAAVTDYIRARANLPDALKQYLALYDEILAGRPDPAGKDRDLEAYLTATVREIGRLEEHAARLEQPDRMYPLTEDARARFSMRVITPLTQVLRGSTFPVTVEARNHGQVTVGSLPPVPVFLAYHWIDSRTGSVLVFEGRRTLLSRPLEPGAARRYDMQVLAPASARSTILRLTMVQDGIAWFDQPPAPVFADLPLEVI